MASRSKQTQTRTPNKISARDTDTLNPSNPEADTPSLNAHQLPSIIAQLRLLAGSVHPEEATNLSKAFSLYFADISLRLSELNSMLLKQQSVIQTQQNQISSLKLALKGAKNDFSEMKSSLILEMEEQRAIAQHVKEQMRLERERLSGTLRELMEESRKKDQEMVKLREESQEEVKRIKERASSMAKTDEYQESRKRVNSVYDKQKIQLLKSQEIKQEVQTEEFLNILREVSGDMESEESQELIGYVQGLFVKIRELQVGLLERQQEIDTQVSFSYLTTSKTEQNVMELSRKDEEIEGLKQRMGRLNRSMDGKDTEIGELRGIIEKYLREKEENNKYLGTKWEHEIERVMLNAEVEFDREKNRIKRAGEERLAEVERMMGDKIQELREENRSIRENKLKKAIERVRELQNSLKESEEERRIDSENHRHLTDQLKRTIGNLNSQNESLSALYKSSQSNHQQQKLKCKEINYQLEYLKLTLHQKELQLESQNKKKLDIQKTELEQEISTFITTSKNSYEEIVKRFQEEQRAREKEQQEMFRRKYDELFVEVNKTKKEYQDICEGKIKQISEEKDDLKKSYQKMMRSSKQEERSRQEELSKVRAKMGQEIKELKDQLNRREEELAMSKEQVEALTKDRKNRDHTIKSKKEEIGSLEEEIRSKEAQYSQLEGLYHSLSEEYQELKLKDSNINSEIAQLRNYFLKEHQGLKEQHLKTERNYRAYIKNIEESCFSSGDRNVYIREIHRLKSLNDGTETSLKNAENKLLTMKQLSKYQSNKIERYQMDTKADSQQYTYRSEGKIKLESRNRFNLTERRGTDKQEILTQKQIQREKNSSTASLYKMYDREDTDKERGEKEREKELERQKEIKNGTRYLKLSKIKTKTKSNFYQQTRFKKSKVGLSNIDSYTHFQSQRDNYRVSTSPPQAS